MGDELVAGRGGRRGQFVPTYVNFLLRRAGIGVGFDVAPLLVYHATQLALHDFERAVYCFCQRFVRAIVDLFFFCH